jgi:pyruvate-formate lyase-activating enzyme
MTKIAPPDPRLPLRLDDLAAVQTTASNHLTFSLTLACPLKCGHCIVDAGPDKGYTTMPLEVAKLYAGQMGELYERGIRRVSFTGGEPLLAHRQLKVLSEAAGAAGMHCGVVTAAHWARTAAAAAKTIEDFSEIVTWDISIDSYHEPYVPFDNVRRAYEAAVEQGRRATIRFAYHDPLRPEDERILEFVGAFADEADVCSQRIRAVGRGTDLDLEESHKFHAWTKPCITQGMVIRYDGSMAPCCVNLVEARKHPFQFGDARERPLTEVFDDYMKHPLLQMLRVVGFTEALRWIEEDGLADELQRPLPDDVCDLCPKLFKNPRISSSLAARAATPGNRIRTAVLGSRILDEHSMLHATVDEFRADGTDREIEGFEFAAQLAAETQSSPQREESS